MGKNIAINNQPNADEIWAGIGGHFDNLGQIINEFLDNSISNFAGNPGTTRNIIVSLKELSNSDVEISVEDSGTGIKKLDEAFTLGSCSASESPLNEHGFGLKHALATANPKNDTWVIYTRVEDDVKNNRFKKISAPYKIDNFSGEIHDNQPWPGKLQGSGTIIQFVCTKEMYLTVSRGLQGGIRAFKTVADVLCEDIGFVYAGVIEKGGASITLVIEDKAGNIESHAIGAVAPNWDGYLKPGSGCETVDLGGGAIDIEYEFGRINATPARVEFDNSTTRRYYMRNMSSSGVEIRINGRVLCYNLFKEIWEIEKHNSYNYLLVKIKGHSKNLWDFPTAFIPRSA